MTYRINRPQPLNGNDVISSERDEYWMRRALFLANMARSQDEVPVGAVLVCNDESVSEGYNCPIQSQDPTAHAEVVALRKGAKVIGNYRLINCSLYVTLEPCMMCVGAMVHARIKRLVFGASDQKAGAVVSQLQMLDSDFLNHRISYAGNILQKDCGLILSDFFKECRREKQPSS